MAMSTMTVWVKPKYLHNNDYFTSVFTPVSSSAPPPMDSPHLPDTIYDKMLHLEWKTFAFRVENRHSQEKFCSSMLVDLYCLSTRP